MAHTKEESSNSRFDSKIFNLRIIDILKQKGLTVRWLAEKIGTSPSSLHTFINGDGSVSINRLIDVARALNVEFPSLFAETGWCGSEDSAMSMMVNGIGFPDVEVSLNSADIYSLKSALGKSSTIIKMILSGEEPVSPLEYSIIAEKLGVKAWRIMPNIKVRCVEDLVARLKAEYINNLA